MAGITRTLNFAEGVETGGPTTTFLQTTEFAVFANDAAYVSSKGAAAEDGDSYYNSTDHVIRFYKNGSWTTMYDVGNSAVVTLTDTQTLTNKRLTSPKINEDVVLSSTSTELNQLDGVSVGGNSAGDILTTNDTQTLTNKTLQLGEDVNLTSTSTELNQLDGVSVGGNTPGDILTTDSTQTLTNKTLTTPAINGSNLNFGTASNVNRVLLPSDTTANLDLLTDIAALLAYDTTLNQVVYNNGGSWSALASTSVVSMRYTTDAGLAINNGVTTDVVFEDIDHDTDSIYNTSTGVATLPASGKYFVSAWVRYADKAWTAGQSANIGIELNGTAIQVISQEFDVTYTTTRSFHASLVVDAAQNDTIEITTFQGSGSSVSLATSGLQNILSIFKIG
jgi:hypothetical protein